jgi:hypothetical protein
LLRAEGLAVLAAATVWYAAAGHSRALFAILFFAPDLSFLGFLAGPRLGAAIYNAAHSYIGPLALGAGAVLRPELATFALIWAAHAHTRRALTIFTGGFRIWPAMTGVGASPPRGAARMARTTSMPSTTWPKAA